MFDVSTVNKKLTIFNNFILRIKINNIITVQMTDHSLILLNVEQSRLLHEILHY